MKSSLLVLIALLLSLSSLRAQETSADTLAPEQPSADAALRLTFPEKPGWNILQEGELLTFQVLASGGSDHEFTYSLSPGNISGMQFDSLGQFSWTPSYDFVDRLSSDSTLQVIFRAENKQGERVSRVIDFTVQHVNRAPEVGELKPFYVRYNTQNTYTIESSVVHDADGDPVVIVPVLEKMPEGARLSAQGEFIWRPSRTQFSRLMNKPLELEFYVEDQPAKARTRGKFLIKVTQQDSPPSIQMVPSNTHFQFKEDATINMKFQLSDPNGEDDIVSFNFISGNSRVPASALVQNTPSQYEFIWKPGYDFVEDPLDSLTFNMIFFVTDRSNQQEERSITLTIFNAVNEAERDRKLYQEYRAAMLRGWDLMEQLKEAEEDLKRRYRRAKRGKKARSLTNASLGAATGVTPVVVDEPTTSKKITTIGGTAVMTIGTLEATEVIGRSTKDLVERLNYIMEKRNELQSKGDVFARKYALRSSRRRQEFMKDVDDFVAVMNLKGLVALELDAGWKNKSRPTDQNIARTFKDFKPEG